MMTLLHIIMWPAMLVVGVTAFLMLAGYARDRWLPHVDIGAWFIGVVFALGILFYQFL